MDKGYIQVFCGDGDGKSSAAIGKGVLGACTGMSVIVVQFMKNKDEREQEFFSRIEPEIKLFRFEKKEVGFDEMTDEQKAEETINIRNGLNYAKKVLVTGECDMLILDEVLGVVDEGIITVDEVKNMLEAKSDETTVIMTGIVLPSELREYVDIVSQITNE